MQTNNSIQSIGRWPTVSTGTIGKKDFDVRLYILFNDSQYKVTLVSSAHNTHNAFVQNRSGRAEIISPTGKTSAYLSNYCVPVGKIRGMVLFGSGNPDKPYGLQPWDPERNTYPRLEFNSDRLDKKEWFGGCLCREKEGDFFTVTRQGNLKRWIVTEEDREFVDGIKKIKVIAGAEEVNLFAKRKNVKDAERNAKEGMKMVLLENQIFVFAQFGDYNNRKEEWFRYDLQTKEMAGPLSSEESKRPMVFSSQTDNFGSPFFFAKKIEGLRSKDKLLASATVDRKTIYVVIEERNLFKRLLKKQRDYKVLCNVAY